MSAADGWNVYLSGEIHSDWRERIAEGVEAAGLPVTLLAPVTDHGASDDVGVDILGGEDDAFGRTTRAPASMPSAPRRSCGAPMSSSSASATSTGSGTPRSRPATRRRSESRS